MTMRLKKSEKCKCKHLHLGWNEFMNIYKLLTGWVGSSYVEKDLDLRLNTGQQCALSDNKD